MEYNKPYKSIDELIDILKDRNLSIVNHDFASDVLSTIGYYDLINGYKKIFYKDSEHEEYKNNLSINYLYDFYYIDKEFQNIVLNAILLIENIFKNSVSQLISEKYGVHENEYLNKSNFPNQAIKINKKNVHVNTFLHQIIEKKVNSENPSRAVKHYREKHKQIPSWILFKDFSFSEIINYYKFLSKEDKKIIADKMISANISTGDKTSHLSKMLSLLRIVRNIIAHNDTFIGFAFKHNVLYDDINKMMPILSKKRTEQTRSYSFICFIIILLRVDILRKDFIAKIIRFNSYNDKNNYVDNYYKCLDLPSDFIITINNYFMHLNGIVTPIKGNRRRKIYHTKDGLYYSSLNENNTIYFSTEEEAVRAGYRKSLK